MADAESVGPRVMHHVEALRQRLAGGALRSILTPEITLPLELALAHCGAHEGTLWCADLAEEFLVPVFNNGPNAETFLAKIRQPLTSGMISMTYAAAQRFAESEVYQHVAHDGKVDRETGNLTCSMMAVPFSFGGGVRGVVSAVKLKPASQREAPDPPPFGGRHLDVLAASAAAVGLMVEARLLNITLGVEIS